MRYVKLFFLVLFLGVAVLFLIQNYETLTRQFQLELNFYFFALLGPALPLYIVILGAFLLGVALSLIFFLMDKITSAGQLKACRRKLARLEQEVTSLRNLPLLEQPFGVEPDTGIGRPDSL